MSDLELFVAMLERAGIEHTVEQMTEVRWAEAGNITTPKAGWVRVLSSAGDGDHGTLPGYGGVLVFQDGKLVTMGGVI